MRGKQSKKKRLNDLLKSLNKFLLALLRRSSLTEYKRMIIGQFALLCLSHLETFHFLKFFSLEVHLEKMFNRIFWLAFACFFNVCAVESFEGFKSSRQLSVDDEQFGDNVFMDRNQVIACTNRHNCELVCKKASIVKGVSKSQLLDALAGALGSDENITDAHKMGVQLGRRRDCAKCGLIYSNCDNALYNMAKTQIFGFRTNEVSTRGVAPPKASNTL